MILRPATADDLTYIRSLVQRPENVPYLTDEDEAALALYLADPATRLVIWGAGPRRGFGMFCNVGQPGHVVELRRLCLDQPGQGEGAAFLQALTDHAFTTLGAARLWLDANGDNLRARRVYLREGFVFEGCQRAHYWREPLGRAVDMALYGMQRDEWLALPRHSGLAATGRGA